MPKAATALAHADVYAAHHESVRATVLQHPALPPDKPFMVVTHGRKGDSDQQAASERVRSRSTELLRLLDPQAVGQRLQTLLAAVEPGEAPQVSQSVADDRAFLDRWGYDDGQREAIRLALTGVAES